MAKAYPPEDLARRVFLLVISGITLQIAVIVFLLLISGFYVNGFFLMGTADMRGFFSTIPLFLIFFIPAVTMRLWAEEYRRGTFELLMTLPMTRLQIVLGKYFAGLAFFTTALMSTLTLTLAL